MTSCPPEPMRWGRVSAGLCVLVALAVGSVWAIASVHQWKALQDDLRRESVRLAKGVLAQVGESRDPETLRAHLQALAPLGVTGLRVLDDDSAALESDEREVVHRAHGLEVAVSLAPADSVLAQLVRRQLLAGLALMASAAGAAGAFIRKSPAIRAAERVDNYARKLEQHNAQLSEAKEIAESADKAKTEFLANVSHELRTPLTAILGFTDVLVERSVDDPADAEHVESARTIQRNGQYLYRLLAGLLDYADLEAGRMPLVWQSCSPADVLRDVELAARPDAQARRLRLRSEVDGNLPLEIISDATRVRQILMELVGNAIKFTDEGSVSLRASLLTEGYTHSQIAFDVIDTGVGMSDAQLERAFESFEQADGSRTRRYGGVGLGLALCRRLAQLLHGNLMLVSTPMEGSAIRLILPVEPPEEVEVALGEEDEDGDAQTLSCSVLVAEDGEDNRRLLEFVLGRAGAQLTLVEDGQKAAQLALQAARTGDPFDVILMDLQMPGTDGIQATRTLRLEGYTGPIIALTADARVSNREECLRVGCDVFLTKPIDRRKLIATLHAITKG